MKILKKGEKHVAYVWHCECSTCGSILEFVNGKDPACGPEVCYNCDASMHYTRYVCPVCGSLKVAFEDSAFGKTGNATYEKRVIKPGEFETDEITQEAFENLDWINDRSRYWPKDAE